MIANETLQQTPDGFGFSTQSSVPFANYLEADFMNFSKKEWAKNNVIKMRQYRKKWRDNNKEKDKQIKKNYYNKNKDRQKELVLKWSKENRDKVRVIQNRSYHKNLRNSKEYMYKANIRGQTRYKYGKLPEGMEYHHLTKPYDKDIWIGVYSEEHCLFENIKEEDLK